MKKIVLVFLIQSLLLSAAIDVSASRKRNMEQNVQNEVEENAAKVQELTVEEHANREYIDNLPGKNKKNSYSGYKYGDVEINVPDFSEFTDYDAEEINNLSDAMNDYLGWDILLGTSDWSDDEGGFYFKPIEGLSSTTNSTFGYGRKMFGCGEYKFMGRVKNKSGEIGSSWLGISFMCTTTQSLQWTGNPGYLVVVKNNQSEMQKWFNSCIMLDTVPTTALKHDTWQEFCINVTPLDVGKNITLSIDGEQIFSIDDTEEPYSPDEGYFNLYGNFDEMAFKAVEGESNISGGRSGQGTDNKNNQPTEKADTDKIVLKGTTAQIGDETKEIPEIFFENGAAMLPLRSISGLLGGYVNWDNNLKTATLNCNGGYARFTETYDEYEINSKLYRSPAKTVMKDGNLYVAINGLAQFFNVKASVSGNTVTLNIK